MFKKLVIMLLIIFLIIPSVSVFASNSEQPTAEVIFSHDEAVLDEVIFFVVVIYLPFGNELTPDASNTNRFRFGGMYWDAHRSEYMTPNRMMNPRLGRWTQPDPFFHMRFGQARMMGSPNAIAQAGNLFVFTMNNPVMWRDPTGLFAQCALCCCGFIPIPWSPRATSPWDTSRKNPNSPVNQGNASNSSNAVTTPPGAAPPRIPLIINASNSFIGGAILNIYDIGGGGGGGSGGSGGSGSSSSLPHQPWDRFATMDAAAIAFAVTRTGHADILNREIGAIIYSVTVGPRWNNTQFYTFGRPWVGQQYNVVAGFITRLLVPEIPSPWHANARMVALAHTHPFGSTLFSQEDMNITTGRYNIFGVGVPAMPVYMAVNTPAGLEVRVFTSDMCQTTQLGGRLIYSR